MEEAQLALLVGSAFIDHWQYFLAGFTTIFAGAISLTWLMANLINNKKIEILEIRLANQRDHFEQYQAVVEQRILTLQEDAERLKNAYQTKRPRRTRSPDVKESSPGAIAEPATPAFLRRGGPEENAMPKTHNTSPMLSFVERTDAIAEIIDGALLKIETDEAGAQQI